MKSLFSKIIKRKNKPSSPPQEQQCHESTVEQFDDYQDQLINMLIGMSQLISIAEKSDETRGEYYTLRHVNEMLCQQRVEVKDLAEFMINKSSELMSWHDAEQKCKPKKSSHNQQTASRSPSSVMRHFYSTYSNGLLYQYYPVRCLLWKILIGYLPQFKNKWVSISEANLIKYEEYVKGFIIDVAHKNKNKSVKTEKKIEYQKQKEAPSELEASSAVDHPLNRQKESKWKNYFQDSELWRLLEKDTKRTRPSSLFFSTKYTPEFSCSTIATQLSLAKNAAEVQQYSDCLTRILFIYLKNHPQCTYCQGMNELASIMLYSFVKGNSEYGRRVGQSDAYFCFQVMIYLSGGDHAFTNGEKMINKLQDLLKRVDLRFYEALSSFNTLHSLKLIAIRWFSSMFLSQFGLDGCLILYDTFLAVASLHSLFSTFTEPSSIFPHKLSLSDWQVYLGLAVIYLNRNELGEGADPMAVFKDGIGRAEALAEKALGLYKMYHGVVK